MRRKTEFIIDGERWVTVVRAAEIIDTTTARVRKLMGTGALEWAPSKPSSLNFVIRLTDVAKVALEHHAEQRAKERAKRLRKPKKAKPIPHPILPTAPPPVIDPFNNRKAVQKVLPMPSGRGGSGWLGQKPRK